MASKVFFNKKIPYQTGKITRFFIPLAKVVSGLKSLNNLLKHIKKRFGKGFTFLVVPNSYGSVKSVAIPFPVLILIATIIILNILIFAGFTTQVCQIYRFRQQIWEKDAKITRLLSEQKEVQPTLKRSYEIAEELSQLKAERAKMVSTLKSIQQKGGRVGTTASRGVSLRIPPYDMVSLQEPTNANLTTSLAQLNHNLGQLQQFIEQETSAQSQLKKELVDFDIRLDHTPSKWPVASKIITSGFGNRFHPTLQRYRFHSGVDIRANIGSKVYATADGVVVYAGYRGGYGYTVVVSHGYGYHTLYGHNSKLVVQRGDKIKKGQLLCYSGNSGTSTGPHLHYEVQVNGKPVNPVMFLRN